MKDNRKYHSDEEISRIKIYNILYADKEKLEEEIKNAKNSGHFWCICGVWFICGAISELNSLIEALKEF